ncbi:MAG: TetR/AcrR family transcriptional regulator [Sedimentisphaerales bacterium]|nr:TetR/AcrR family transcriptional regulator [Sedimentisphaerales bacterium]
MGKAGLRRKEREKLQHREEILDAALRLFSEKGFHNVSVQEIAEEAEFSVGTLYNFFASKESLFAGLMSSCAKRISEILVPILDEKTDERGKISNFIHAHKQIIESYASSIRLYLSQDVCSVLTVRPDVEPEADAVRDTIQQKLSSIFKSGVRKGVFKEMDPRAASLSLSAMLESFVFSMIKEPERMQIELGLSLIEELFFKGALKDTEA